jgi:hypothetical protein
MELARGEKSSREFFFMLKLAIAGAPCDHLGLKE